jgi:hypothetical protein
MTEIFDKSKNNLIYAKSMKVLWYSYNLQKCLQLLDIQTKLQLAQNF